MAQCYLTNQSQECTYIIESSIFSGDSLQGDYLDTLNFIISTGCIVILSTNDGQFYYSSHSADNSQGIQTWYFIGINNSYIGYIISFNEFAESWDLRSINIPDVSKYLPLTGGTLTGNLTGKYIVGTWLQTTEVTEANSTLKVAVIDNSGWIYYRTLEHFKTDLSIPTNTSQLTNDSGYANETWVTQQIQSAINATWEASY